MFHSTSRKMALPVFVRGAIILLLSTSTFGLPLGFSGDGPPESKNVENGHQSFRSLLSRRETNLCFGRKRLVKLRAREILSRDKVFAGQRLSPERATSFEGATTHDILESESHKFGIRPNADVHTEIGVPVDANKQKYNFYISETGRELVPARGVASRKLSAGGSTSIIGDSGMKSESLRIAVESWNFCNRAGPVDSGMGGAFPSPRYADCADVVCQTDSPDPATCEIKQLVSTDVNELKVGMPFPSDFKWPSHLPSNLTDPDVYAVAKEIYLGGLCVVDDGQKKETTNGEAGVSKHPWNFWMIMVKNGNFDPDFGLCPPTSTRGGDFILPRFNSSSATRPDTPQHQNLVRSSATVAGNHPSRPIPLSGGDPAPEAPLNGEPKSGLRFGRASGSASSRNPSEPSHASNSEEYQIPPKSFHGSPEVVRVGNKTVVTLNKSSVHRIHGSLARAPKMSNGFPCFGLGCMNQPKVQHRYSEFQISDKKVVGVKGGFYGTYDIMAGNASTLKSTAAANVSSSVVKEPQVSVSHAIRNPTHQHHYRNVSAITSRPEYTSAPFFSITTTEANGTPNTIDLSETPVNVFPSIQSSNITNATVSVVPEYSSVPAQPSPISTNNVSIAPNGPPTVDERPQVDSKNVTGGSKETPTGVNSDSNQTSHFSVEWEKDLHTGSWVLNHKLRVSQKYPWLMLYIRADVTSGVSGGYPWETRGMMTKVPTSPNFRVRHTLNVISSGGSASQFYLIDVGGCWKNSGSPCDGDVKSDVTRYSEMILNLATPSWCSPSQLSMCPPFHTKLDGTIISRNDVLRFPYDAYHLYCSPSNALFPHEPVAICDPYSNPQPQELVQLLPHEEWAPHGLPGVRGEGWLNGPKSWDMDMGALTARLYFYQDPLSTPATRCWPSIDVGTEIHISSTAEQAEWTLSDFDVLVEESKV